MKTIFRLLVFFTLISCQKDDDTKEVSIPTADYEVSTVAELNTALSKVKAGETIILNGGTYAMTSKITIATSGTSDKIITLKAKEGAARPKFDFRQCLKVLLTRELF